MTRYSVTDARREFFRLLDAVDSGETVILERRGVSYRIVREHTPKTLAEPPSPPVLIEDEDVLRGQWTWETDDEGSLEFRASGDDAGDP